MSEGPLHRLEVVLRGVAGWALALLLWRPGRRRLAAGLAGATRVILVRLDNRVGEALLTTPLVDALAGRYAVELLVHPRCVRVLEGLPGVGAVLPFERRWLWLGPFGSELRRLRRWTAGAVVVNAANWKTHSGTNAIVSRLIAPRACVLGPSARPAGLLVDVPVPPTPGTESEVLQRLALLTPLVPAPTGRMGFREPRASEGVRAFRAAQPAAYAVVNPGGRLGERRVPPGVFAAACRALTGQGVTPVLTWGPGEEALAREVGALAPGAVVAPPTDLDELAFLMKGAARVVCNNTGPMHLAVAVGAPTVALFFRMPVERWGHQGAAHRMVDLTPCRDEAEMGRAVEAVLGAGGAVRS